MPIKPIGWLCGQVINRFAGQAYVLQRIAVEIIDDIKDELPNIVKWKPSNQQNDSIVQGSVSVVASVLSSSHAVRVINVLSRVSAASKSVAKFLQPQLVRKFAELDLLSGRLLQNPHTPLYTIQTTRCSLCDVICYPAKTAITSLMFAFYATLIYMALFINTVLSKIKEIIQEKSSRENTKDSVDKKDLSLKYDDAARCTVPSPVKQVVSEFPVENSISGSIHILHSALDQEKSTAVLHEN
ncbi:PREDICTED: spermatogenesis-associated protein 9 [Gavialis gangeticus]|uniref:spermatogenesis-associated protein 9 n=1 Tax=Gavialis gangeticus TaxID=94835 RepID=UPI00092F3623|nr:PREDICTED: spermatogenesis-associated protein 9 [Gavialis gangeticus]